MSGVRAVAKRDGLQDIISSLRQRGPVRHLQRFTVCFNVCFTARCIKVAMFAERRSSLHADTGSSFGDGRAVLPAPEQHGGTRAGPQGPERRSRRSTVRRLETGSPHSRKGDAGSFRFWESGELVRSLAESSSMIPFASWTRLHQRPPSPRSGVRRGPAAVGGGGREGSEKGKGNRHVPRRRISKAARGAVRAEENDRRHL